MLHARPAATAAPGPAAGNPDRARFRSFDEMDDGLEDARFSTYVLEREVRPWQRTSWRLGEVLLQHGLDGAAHASTARMSPGRSGFLVSGDGAAPRLCQGQPLGKSGLLVWEGGAEARIQAPRAGGWWLLTAPSGSVPLIAGASLPEGAPDPCALVVQGHPARMAEIRDLLGEVAIGAGPCPSPADRAERARRLGEVLLAAFTRLFTEGRRASARPRRIGVGRERLVVRVDEIFESEGSDPVYVASLGKALGLPERTLRHVFAEQYGAGPTHVLRCRRLCRVRRALRAEAGPCRVSGLARSAGFHHLGQFSIDYRRLFGESPSETRRNALSPAAPAALLETLASGGAPRRAPAA